jgi:hypothetical protein
MLSKRCSEETVTRDVTKVTRRHVHHAPYTTRSAGDRCIEPESGSDSTCHALDVMVQQAGHISITRDRISGESVSQSLMLNAFMELYGDVTVSVT